ncbi:MAG: ribonuclease HI [Candidatus Paracaedibacteraceae bacterium]|nr:ribonuclease HI [Candidatus Paracaedibacteraceae bacterium]
MPDARFLEFFNSLSTKTIDIYVDGACSGNPGPGGWGAVFSHPEKEITLAGSNPATTNNRMELQAAINAIKAIPTDFTATVYTDSQYVKNGITLWIIGWKKRGWMNSKNEPVKNQDLWQELDVCTQKKKVSWQWVKGHDGHPLNEKADMLARRAIIAERMR